MLAEKIAWVGREPAAPTGRFVPDAISTFIVLVIALVALSLGIGTSLSETMDAYYATYGACSR